MAVIARHTMNKQMTSVHRKRWSELKEGTNWLKSLEMKERLKNNDPMQSMKILLDQQKEWRNGADYTRKKFATVTLLKFDDLKATDK